MGKTAIVTYRPVIIFLLCLLAMAFYYDYHQMLSWRPHATHKWRQTDCASLALNYYQGGMKFLEPQTHNLTSNEGTTGHNCTSEIPILYYGVAGVYHITGPSEFVYRLFCTLLFFLGLFYLFRLLMLILKDPFWSIVLTLVVFTSPVLVYYGNNFLSNTPAFSLSLIGWYFFYRSLDAPIFYWRSMVFLGLAACLKITALFSLFAIAGIFILDLIPAFSVPTPGIRRWKLFLPIAVILGVVLGWIAYASHYNSLHGSTYFSTTLFPIWSLDSEGQSAVWEAIANRQIWNYFNPAVYLLMFISAVIAVIRFKKLEALWRWVLLIILFEILTYFLLQFWTFANHDYYTINMFILPAILLIAVSSYLKSNHESVLKSPVIKGLLVLLVAYGMYDAELNISERYNPRKLSNLHDWQWMDIAPVLAELEIGAQDTVIAIPGDSHAPLYWMNVKGWTNYIDTQFNRGEKKYYNKDAEGIRASIENGARYLMINGDEQFFEKPFLKDFCTHRLRKHGHIYIFDLQNPTVNFTVPDRRAVQTISCGAELLKKGGEWFLSEEGKELSGGTQQSNSQVLNGDYSIRLGPDAPYGMTYEFDRVQSGESFEVTVWRYGASGQTGQIVAACTPHEFYDNSVEVIDKEDNGWERVLLEFTIPDGWKDEKLKIYLHDSSGNEVFYDDLVMIRYAGS